MEFLKDCARRLDEGEAACDVLRDMWQRYTTPGCLKVKTCLVRNMCRPSEAYLEALNELDDADADALLLHPSRPPSSPTLRSVWSELPPAMPSNVRDLCICRDETRACKRAANAARVAGSMMSTLG